MHFFRLKTRWWVSTISIVGSYQFRLQFSIFTKTISMSRSLVKFTNFVFFSWWRKVVTFVGKINCNQNQYVLLSNLISFCELHNFMLTSTSHFWSSSIVQKSTKNLILQETVTFSLVHTCRIYLSSLHQSGGVVLILHWTCFLVQWPSRCERALI